MGQVSPFLRRAEGGYSHWCPACGEMHMIPDRWTFNGNVNCPSFSPSVKITGKKAIVDAKGEWTGEWALGPDGKALDDCCHYVLTDGVLNFCTDCLHELKGQSVPLPELPEWLRDDARIQG